MGPGSAQRHTTKNTVTYNTAAAPAREDPAAPAAELPHAITRLLVLGLIVGAAVGSALALASCQGACSP
jgi:hypothetical protein